MPVQPDKTRILIVFDDAEYGEKLRKFLDAFSDFQVVGVTRTGREGIRLALETKPNVTLLDERIRDVDCISTLGHLVQGSSYNYIIVMTPLSGGVSTEFIREALLAGAQDLLIYPPNSEELTGSIRNFGTKSQEGIPARSWGPKMGYQLTSLYSISPDDVHSYFVFYLGDRFDDIISQWIDKNFAAIAEALGPRAVIVRGLSEEFNEQVLQTYGHTMKTVYARSRWNKPELLQAIDDLLVNYGKRYGVASSKLLPLLMLTDRNPSRATDNLGEGVFYLVPLGEFDREANIREIVHAIVDCIQLGEFDALEDLLARKLGKASTNLLKVINQSLELKPNVAGVGINLNGIIDLITGKQR